MSLYVFDESRYCRQKAFFGLINNTPGGIDVQITKEFPASLDSYIKPGMKVTIISAEVDSKDPTDSGIDTIIRVVFDFSKFDDANKLIATDNYDECRPSCLMDEFFISLSHEDFYFTKMELQK